MDAKEKQRQWEKERRKKNPERARINSYRGTAKTFMKNYATLEDIKELEDLIAERKRILKEPRD